MSDLTPIPKSSSPPKSDMADSADSNTSPSPCPALEAASPNTSLSRHSTPASGSNKADSGDEVSNSAGTQSDARESGHGKRGRKRDPGSKAMTQLMNLTGLDAVKDHFEKIRRAVEINRLLGVDIRRERYHAVFQGNPGTGELLTPTCAETLELLTYTYVLVQARQQWRGSTPIFYIGWGLLNPASSSRFLAVNWPQKGRLLSCVFSVPAARIRPTRNPHRERTHRLKTREMTPLIVVL